MAVATLLLAGLCYHLADRLYTATALSAFGLHVATAIVALRYLPYNWDIWTYHQTALELLAGQPTGETLPTVAFGWVVAGLYTVFGVDVRVTAVFNSLLAVVLVLPLAVLARRLYPTLDETDGMRTLALFLPLSFLFTSLPMRDTLALALFVGTLAAAASALTRKRLAAIPTVVGLVTLGLFRVELAGLILAGCCLAVGVAIAEWRLKRSVRVSELVVGVGITGLAGFVPFSMRYSIGTLNTQLSIRGVGGAVYFPEFRYDSWLDVVLAAPIRGFYFQFTPFPLHVDSPFDLAALLVLPLLVVLVVAGVRSLATREWETPVGAMVGLVYVGGVLGYGLVDTNFGTTVRHRIPFVFVLVVFAGPVLARWWSNLRQWLRRPGVVPDADTEDRRDEQETSEGRRLGGSRSQ